MRWAFISFEAQPSKVIKALIERKEHIEYEREERDGVEQDRRTGKNHYKNCYTGCPFQAIFENATAVRGGTASDSTRRTRDRACAECSLPDGPPWEVGVIDRARFVTLPEAPPYWLALGVGFMRAQSG